MGKVREGDALLSDVLRHYSACSEAISMATAYGADQIREAWQNWPIGEHMLWIASRIGVDPRKCCLAACECVKLVTRFLPPDDVALVMLSDVARAWANGADEHSAIRVIEHTERLHTTYYSRGEYTPRRYAVLAVYHLIDEAPIGYSGGGSWELVANCVTTAIGESEDSEGAHMYERQRLGALACANAVRSVITAEVMEAVFNANKGGKGGTAW